MEQDNIDIRSSAICGLFKYNLNEQVKNMLIECKVFDSYATSLLKYKIEDFDEVNLASVLEPIGVMCPLDYENC